VWSLTIPISNLRPARNHAAFQKLRSAALVLGFPAVSLHRRAITDDAVEHLCGSQLTRLIHNISAAGTMSSVLHPGDVLVV